MGSRPVVYARESWPVVSTPLGGAPEVPVQFFLKHFLPPLSPRVDIAKIVSSLKRRGKKGHRAITDQGRWRRFATDPKLRNDPDRIVFAPLKQVAKAILNEGSMRHAVQVLDYRHNPSPSVLHCRTRASRSDMYLVPKTCSRTDPDLRWMDVTVPGEYAKGDSDDDKKKNAEKISWSMRNCMREDPRRRFVLGFTMENTDTRFWFCDRSQVVVCRPFNFIAEHAHIVHFLLAAMTAEPSQMGHDPTMKLIDDGRNIQYDIAVQSDSDGTEMIYRTLSLLSDVGATALRGRGTRVWKAIKVVDGEECGEPVALKDSWVDGARPREGSILREVRGAAHSEELREFVEKLFVTVECYGDVFVDEELHLRDATRPLMIPAENVSASMHPLKPATPDLEDETVEKTRAASSSRSHDKVHHRIVFKEICKSMYEENSLVAIFKLLGQAVGALRIMHDAGWIHHDISPGNILVDEDGFARLVDLEYAQRMDDSTRQEIRVGTANFMAAEVDNQQYYHLEYLDFPEPPVQNSGSVTVTSLLSAVEKGERVDIPLPRHPRIGRKNYIFRYNPLHDLESLWWIAIYFLVNKEITCNNEEEPSSSDPDISWRATIEQRAHAEALFYHNQPRVNVMLAFGRDFEYIISTLSPSLQPIAFILDDVRKLLIGGYQRAERNPETIDHTAADGLHEYFITAFFEIAGDLADQSLVVHPFVDLPSTSMDHE